MPTLLMFAPCEKVIVSNDNTCSLITLVEVVRIGVLDSPTETLPEGAAIPFNWAIFTLWKPTDEERGRRFQQMVHLIAPSGEAVLEAPAEFEFEPDKRTHRVMSRVMGFPILPAGEYNLKLSLREAGQENVWREITEYPILIIRHAGNEAL